MRRLACVLCLGLLAACGGTSKPPQVEWNNYPPNVQQGVQDRIEAGDCDGLQHMFNGAKDADLLDYLDWQMRRAGCY